MARYFRVLVDSGAADQWFLAPGPQPNWASVDPRRFTSCQPVGPTDGPIHLVVQQPGGATAFHLGSFDMPVVESELGERLAAAAPGQLELVPAVIDGHSATVVIANVLTSVDCIDESRTVGEKWDAQAGRPDKVGQYRTIVHLHVDPARIDADIFRVDGWKIALVVSDRLVNETGLTAVHGIRLHEV